MPHRRCWRNGRGGLEAQSDHLPAERLADMVSTSLPSSADPVTKGLFRGAPPQRPADEPSPPPDVHSEKLGGSEPVVPEQAVAQPFVPEPAITSHVVIPPAVNPPTVSKTGRHRRPAFPTLKVGGFSFTSRSLVLMTALALLLVVAVVLFALS
jgi:hypothetical protein